MQRICTAVTRILNGAAERGNVPLLAFVLLLAAADLLFAVLITELLRDKLFFCFIGLIVQQVVAITVVTLSVNTILDARTKDGETHFFFFSAYLFLFLLPKECILLVGMLKTSSALPLLGALALTVVAALTTVQHRQQLTANANK